MFDLGKFKRGHAAAENCQSKYLSGQGNILAEINIPLKTRGTNG
jgi:hypothetical protein